MYGRAGAGLGAWIVRSRRIRRVSQINRGGWDRALLAYDVTWTNIAGRRQADAVTPVSLSVCLECLSWSE